MVLSLLSKSRPFLGLWQFVSLCLRRWNSFKMSVDDSACLLMFSHDRHRGPLRAFGRSPEKAVILQSLLPDEFPDWKVGGSADGRGRISSVEGVTAGAPRAAQRVSAVPLVPAVVFTPSASVFPPPKFGGVTDVHWMDWVVSMQWLQWSCTCLPAMLQPLM